MQANSVQTCNPGYDVDMPAGRPATTKRTDFGKRLYELRQNRGLSQRDVADTLGITQQSYAAWERRPIALKPEQLAALVQILGCSVDDLLGLTPKPVRRGGPTGKTRQVFEQVSKLPRAQQRKIVDVVEALVAQGKAS